MSLRKIVFWIHLSAGCLAGSIVLIMSITGVLLAYERQITAWTDRGFRSSPASPDARRLPIEAMLTQAVSQNRGAPSSILLRSEPGAPAEVTFGRDRVVLVDVYSGAVLGEGSSRIRSFFQTVENWHRWLGASDEHRTSARAVTGACNFAFLVLVVSGPFLWLPRRWSTQSVRAVSWFRKGLSGKARDFNWHNTIGIWCAAPLLLIAFSGVVMSYPWANNLLYKLTGTEAPAQGNGRGGGDGRPRGDRQPKTSLAGLDAAWARAEQQVPGWRSISLRPPASGRGPAAFTIDVGIGGRPDQRSQLTLDMRTGEVIRWEPFSSYNTGRRIRSWLRFLHTGEAGGIAGETVAGIASMGGAFLVWTGISLALRRVWRWKGRRPAAAQTDGERVGATAGASRE